MSINAHIKDNTIKLYYDLNEHNIFPEVEYGLGEELLNFVWLSSDYIRQGYEKLLELYSCKEAFSKNDVESDEIFDKSEDLANTIDNNYIYLHFYTKNLMWFLYEYPFERHDKATNQDMLDRFIKKGFPYFKTVLEYGKISSYQIENTISNIFF